MVRTKYIYILSQRYSGSTLLSFLLGTHPHIATIGERRKFYTHSFEQNQNYDQSCSCGKPFKECEHWNAIKKALLERLDINDFKTNPTEFRLFANKHLQKLAYEFLAFSTLNKLPHPFSGKLKRLNKFNLVLIEEIMKLNDGKIFLDSSKSLDQCFFLSQIKEIDLHVVWLSRDPRAQVNSAMKYNSWSVEEATERWKGEMIDNEKMLKKLKVNYSALNYELLCRTPEQEMSRLLKEIGVDDSSFSLNFREKAQHIMGNYSMRLGTETKIKERKEWQTDLNQNQKATIERLTQEFKQYYSENI